ncbi:MAG: LysR family transcriptional regulator [Rikenellaceae bacterium]
MITDFRLNVFITVARSLSFTRAAAILNISQPAISKHIKELERDFGEALFDRKGNTISLTPKGRDIIPHVETILGSYNTLNDTIKSEDSLYEGVLHVGASTTIAQYVLPSILAQFNKRYPRVSLSVISANSDNVVNALKRKEIDIAIIEGDNTDSSVHYTPFANDEIVLVSTRGGVERLKIEDITKLPLLIREEGSGTLSVIMSALRENGISRKSLNIRMQLGSSEAIQRYVKSSDTYAFLSILVARDHIERGELKVVEVENMKISRQFRFVSRHGQSRRLLDLFRDFCRSHYNF